MANITSMGNMPYKLINVNPNRYDILMEEMNKENKIIVSSSLDTEEKKKRLDANISTYEKKFSELRKNDNDFFSYYALGSLCGGVFYICVYLFFISLTFLSPYFVILFISFYILQLINFYYMRKIKLSIE